MSKRSVYTTITPLPPGITRFTVLDTLHTHVEMIDLNPLVIERHPIKPPPKATPEEFHCQWYELTDKIQYLPGGLYSGKVSYTACFHDLANGVQTHVYAPMGLDIRGTWTIGGSLPGEPQEPVEMGKGIPLQGLYLREDTDMTCNVFLTNFVKKNLKNSHAALVARMVVKAQLAEQAMNNDRMSEVTNGSLGSPTASPRLSLARNIGSIHQHSPLGSPGFPSPGFPSPGFPIAGQGGMYPDPLAVSSPSPFAPGRHPQQYDPRFSIQPQQSFGSSPGYQMDPAYQNANPYMQNLMNSQYGQGQWFQSWDQGSSHPSELASDDASTKQTDLKGDVSSAGPPVHPCSEPVEMPTEQYK